MGKDFTQMTRGELELYAEFQDENVEKAVKALDIARRALKGYKVQVGKLEGALRRVEAWDFDPGIALFAQVDEAKFLARVALADEPVEGMTPTMLAYLDNTQPFWNCLAAPLLGLRAMSEDDVNHAMSKWLLQSDDMQKAPTTVVSVQ